MDFTSKNRSNLYFNTIHWKQFLQFPVNPSLAGRLVRKNLASEAITVDEIFHSSHLFHFTLATNILKDTRILSQTCWGSAAECQHSRQPFRRRLLQPLWFLVMISPPRCYSPARVSKHLRGAAVPPHLISLLLSFLAISMKFGTHACSSAYSHNLMPGYVHEITIIGLYARSDCIDVLSEYVKLCLFRLWNVILLYRSTYI